MQSKIYNAYRLTHKDGSIEDINALDLIQALENTEIPETESKVIQTVLLKENVKTLVAENPTEIMFTSTVAQGGTGSIATPSQGTVHEGDSISLKAIPARNSAFVNWKMNGEVIGESDTLLYTIPKLGEGLNSIVFTATFQLADVNWTSKVEPVEASGAGCLAFPASGTTKANESVSLIAVSAEGFTFDHWERNGENIGTNKILTANATPLIEGENECIYKAVFNVN